jgi:hypothetical protein
VDFIISQLLAKIRHHTAKLFTVNSNKTQTMS